MTRQRTAYRQADGFDAFKNAVLEFANAAGPVQVPSGKVDPMQVGSIGDGHEVPWEGSWETTREAEGRRA